MAATVALGGTNRGSWCHQMPRLVWGMEISGLRRRIGLLAIKMQIGFAINAVCFLFQGFC